MKIDLLPEPKSITMGTGRFVPDLPLKDFLEDPVLSALPESLIYKENNTLPEGAYSLLISENGITITASSRSGQFNGLLSLAQIYKREKSLPCCSIDDCPLFENRAVMIDISRNRVYKLDYLKDMIRLFALLKYNQLQLYTEHTFAYKGHEKVWKDFSPYTPEDIREIDTFCTERGIELVPNQNSFGHMERWFAHESYHHLAEAPGGFEDSWGVRREHSSTLYPGNPESLDFVKGLYDQLLPQFKSRRFNIGCDETFDLGLGKSKSLVEEKGEGEVYLDFFMKVAGEAAGRGYEVQFWADILLNYPELVSRIPEEYIAVNWGYEKDHPFEKETGILAGAGRKFYVCTGTSSWNSSAGRWSNAWENIKNGAYWAEKNGAMGYMVTDWGECGHWQQPVASWPGYLMAAQAAWKGDHDFPGDDDPFWTNALNALVFKGKGDNPAGLLKSLANLYKECPVTLHNGSVFNYILADPFYPYYRKHFTECRTAGMGHSIEYMKDWEKQINALPLDCPYKEELETTVALCRLGILFVKVLFDAEDADWRNIPEDERKRLLIELKTFAEVFKNAWSLSSRPGGLHDSMEKLLSWVPRLES